MGVWMAALVGGGGDDDGAGGRWQSTGEWTAAPVWGGEARGVDGGAGGRWRGTGCGWRRAVPAEGMSVGEKTSF